MNEILTEKELHQKYNIMNNSGGGDCLFLSVAQIDDRNNHIELRNKVCKQWKKMKKNNPDYYNLLEISGDLVDDDGLRHDISICEKNVWGSETDVALLAEILNRKIIIYSRITNKKTYDGKNNANYNKYTRLHEKSPGDIFVDNKKIINDPIYLKLKITRNYGHFEAMKLKNNYIDLTINTNSTSNNTNTIKSTSSKKSNTKSKRKTRSKKEKKSKTKTRKSPEKLYSTDEDERNFQLAIQNSLKRY